MAHVANAVIEPSYPIPPQEETHMDSKDNLQERFAALEQRTEQLHQQTRMVERRLRWWRGLACGVLVLGLLSGALPSGQTVDAHRRDLSARVAELEGIHR